MERKDFIRACGFACASSIGLTALLQGCTSARLVSGKIVEDDLIVSISDFENRNGRQGVYRPYLIVRHEILQYPICVFRKSENEYTALWMRCTHQGTELQVFGDKLQCPAHGSEFTTTGTVQSGPADSKLRTFPVSIDKEQLKISLKAA